MPARTIITCTGTFPDDAVWDEEDNLVSPAGREFANVIHDRLREVGLRTDEIGQHDHYGWEFSIFAPRCEAWFLIQLVETWIIHLENHTSLFRRLLGRADPSQYAEIQRQVDAILKSDLRVTNVLWYTFDDFEKSREDRASPEP